MTDSPVCYIFVGDNESVLLLLLIPRLSYKTELLQSQLRQKVHFVFVFLEFFYITVQTLLTHWLKASIVYEGTDNRNGAVTQHEVLFMTFVQGGYEGDYDNLCIFLTWSCVVEIYSSIACDN